MSSCKKESSATAKEPAWLKQDLLAYYPLDGNVKDSSGNGLDGVPNGVLKPIANKNGKPYSALNFKEAEFNANINNTFFNQNFSVSLWVQWTEYTISYPSIIWGNCFHIGFTSNPIPNILNTYLYHPTAGVFGLVDGVLNYADWNHVTITNSNGISSLYINGTFVNTSPTGRSSIGTAQTNFITIGRAIGSILKFEGSLDNIRFYKRALTAEEVKYLSQQ
jgi:hypothetical protein